MAGPTTDIEIMNIAALLLGKNPFTTVDPKDKFAVSMQTFFDLLKESELGKIAWKFAKKQIQLSQIAGFDPDFAQWNAAYALPSDFLLLVRLYPSIPFQIFENRIYANQTGKLKIEYNHEVPVTSWPAPFKEFMANQLAANVGAASAENENLVARLEGKASQLRSIAMFVDGQNSPNVAFQSNPWIEVRFNGGGRGRYR